MNKSLRWEGMKVFEHKLEEEKEEEKKKKAK